MSIPGLPKAKISLSDARKSAASSAHSSGSLKARSSGGLSSAQRTSVFTRALGSGGRPAGWVAAQRNINPYDNMSMQINRHANMRAEANRYAGIHNMRDVSYVNVATNNNDMSDMMKAAMGVQMGMQAAQSVFGLLNQLGVFGGDKAAAPGKQDALGKGLADMVSQQSASIPTATTLTGQLSSAGSFAELDTLEARANEQKANLDAGYQQLDISEGVNQMLSGEGVQDGLKLANVNLDTSALQLSSLDSSDLEASIKTIETDINEITDFQTSKLPTAKASVTEQSGIIGQQINATNISIEQLQAQKAEAVATGADTSAIDQQIADLQSKLEELNDKKAKLDSANSALAQVETQCGEAITDLKAKQAEIQDLKQFEDSVKDKEYQMAKSQDEQLKKTMDSIDKLTKQIDSLVDKDPSKATKADQNRLAKYNALIQERAGLYQTLGTLTQSLSSAGQTEFTDSNNKTYTLKNLDKAMNYGQAPEVIPLTAGDDSIPGTTGDDSGAPSTDGADGKSAVDTGRFRNLSSDNLAASLIAQAKASGSASHLTTTTSGDVIINITCDGDTFMLNGQSYSEQDCLAALNEQLTIS